MDGAAILSCEKNSPETTLRSREYMVKAREGVYTNKIQKRMWNEWNSTLERVSDLEKGGNRWTVEGRKGHHLYTKYHTAIICVLIVSSRH